MDQDRINYLKKNARRIVEQSSKEMLHAAIMELLYEIDQLRGQVLASKLDYAVLVDVNLN